MNSNISPAQVSPEPHPAEIPANGSAQSRAKKPKSKKSRPHARTGKVARLPKNIRDSINRMIEDGFRYRAIVEQLGPDAQGITKHHLTEWKKGGYVDWLGDQQWLQEIRVQQQFGLELLQDGGETKINQVVLQVAVTQVLQMLRHLVPANLIGKFDADPANFTRLLNSISRLSREAIVFRKYDDASAQAQAAALKRLDPNRELGKERDLMVAAMERAMGFKAAPGPIGPDLNEYMAKNAPSALNRNPDRNLNRPSQSQIDAAPLPPAGAKSPAEQNAEIQCEGRRRGAETLINEEPTVSATQTGGEPSIHQSTNPSIPSPSTPDTLNSQLFVEHCLECGSPLPALLPTGARPSHHCDQCHIALPPPGCCVLPSIEQCRNCGANLPRLLADGQRPLLHCPKCLTNLPEPVLPPAPSTNPLIHQSTNPSIP